NVAGGEGGSRVTLNVTAGTTYYVYVDGASPGASGDFSLTVQPPACTTAADCSDGEACTTDSCNAGVCQNGPLDFMCVNNLRLPVTLNANGFTGQLCLNNNQGCAGTMPLMLAPGTYQVGTAYNYDDEGGLWLGSFTLGTNGNVTMNAPLDTYFRQSGAKGEVLTAEVRKVTVNFNGYIGGLVINYVGAISPPSEAAPHANEITLLVGRNYKLYASYTAGLDGQPGGLSTPSTLPPDTGLRLSPQGVLSGDSIVRSSFAVSGLTLSAKAETITLDTGGYQGPIVLGGVGYFEGTGRYRTIKALRNRRYSLGLVYTANLDGAEGALPYAVGVSEDGASVDVYGEAANLFQPVARTLVANVAPIQVEMGNYGGGVAIQGASDRIGAGSHEVVLP